MRVENKIVLVTGAGHGIGAALARRFKQEGAKAVVVADADGDAAFQLAREIGGVPIAVDITREPEIQRLVQHVTQQHGAIDLFCSNAGLYFETGIDTPDPVWGKMREVHVMGHVYAARAVIPKMIERGGGYLLQTVSAAGLLTSLDSAFYAVTKHASLALAEWISITYGDQGIKVSALCSEGVPADAAPSLSVDQVTDAVIAGLAEERFLILPHPGVAENFRSKAADYDLWLQSMRQLRAEAAAE